MTQNEIDKLYDKAERKGQKMFQQICEEKLKPEDYDLRFTETGCRYDAILIYKTTIYMVETKTRNNYYHFTDVIEYGKSLNIEKERKKMSKYFGKKVRILFANLFENDYKYNIYDITDKIKESKVNDFLMEKKHLESFGKVDKRCLEYHPIHDEAMSDIIFWKK